MFIRLRLLPSLAVCGFGALIWYSVLLARADAAFRQNSLGAARTAVRLVPDNAAYHALLAEILEAAGSNPDAELKLAASLSPRESRYWIRLAFRAEVEQKYDECERDLMEAHRVDRGFDPRWALMNYYFRRGKWPEFWKYTREALDMSYGDLDPVFQLCMAANDNPMVTWQIMPARHDVKFAFFAYLVQHSGIDSAAGFAAELASDAAPDDVDVLLDYSRRQINHDEASSLAVWNTLCRRQLIPFSELSPNEGRIVTNGDFVAPPLHQVFDWTYVKAPGIALNPLNLSQGLSIEIDGDQPEKTTIAQQEIPLTPGKRYIVSYDYQLVGGTTPDSGVQWVVAAAGPKQAGEIEPIATSSELSAANWKTGQLAFSAGPRDIANLILQYRRAPGTVRWKGTVEFRKVTSSLAPAEARGGDTGVSSGR